MSELFQGVDDAKPGVLAYGMLRSNKFLPFVLDAEYAALSTIGPTHFLIHEQKMWHYSLGETGMASNEEKDYLIDANTAECHFSVIRLSANGPMEILFNINPTFTVPANKGTVISTFQNHVVGIAQSEKPDFDVYEDPTMDTEGAFWSVNEFYGAPNTSIGDTTRGNELRILVGNNALMRITARAANFNFRINCDLYSP